MSILLNTNLLKSNTELFSTYEIVEESFKKEEVDDIVQEYSLSKQGSVYCDYCKEGKHGKCNTRHQKGFVIKRKNGSFALLGNECAKDFGGNDKIRKKINLLHNKRRLDEKYGKIVKFVDDAESHIRKLKFIRDDMKNWKCLVNNFFSDESLQPQFIRKFENAIKAGFIDVKLKGYQFELDKNGEKDSNQVRHNDIYLVGTIKDIDILDIEKYSRVIKQISRSISAIISAKKIIEEDKKTINHKLINKLNRQIEEIPRIYIEYDKYLQKIEGFKSNDFDMATMIFADKNLKKGFQKLCLIFSIDMIKDVTITRKSYFDKWRKQYNLDSVFEEN